MASTPFARIAAAFAMNPGRWELLQVGVKAPGTANKTAFLWLLNSAPKSFDSVTPNLDASSVDDCMISQIMFEGTISFMAANLRDALDAKGCAAKDLKL